MSLEVEQNKLTSCIDSYPCWNNEIHKKLKLKHYADDCDDRLVNLELIKDMNIDYNNRYFPPKYPQGSNLGTLLEERKLYEKLAEPAKVANVFNSTVEPERFKSSNLDKGGESKSKKIAKEILNNIIDKGISDSEMSEMSKINKKRTEQVKKDFNVQVDRDNLELEEKEELEKSPHSSPKSISSTESTEALTTLYPGTSIADEAEVKEEDKYPKYNTRTQIESELLKIYNKNDKKPLKIENEGKPPYELIFYKSSKSDKMLPQITQSDGTILKGSNLHKSHIENFKKHFIKEDEIGESKYEYMTSSGLKKSKKTKSWLINRFNILKGEILCSNDNPAIIKELKDITKQLYDMGLLNKHL